MLSVEGGDDAVRASVPSRAAPGAVTLPGRASDPGAVALPRRTPDPAPVLIIAVGNPSRGDDAVGPLAAERLARESPDGVEILTDFQLQVEHALDLRGRARVLFVDASASLDVPFTLARLEPRPPVVATTHALPPSAVLHACKQLFGEPPESWLLAIRGESFELGDAPSAAAATALDAALGAAREWLQESAARGVRR